MPSWVELSTLRPKILGTSDTIAQMHRMVALSKLDPSVLKIAQYIRTLCPQKKDYGCLAQKIFEWVKRHGLFTRHMHQIQKIESVPVMIGNIAWLKQVGAYRGTAWFSQDCPGYSIWVATLGGVLGFPYSYETVMVDSTRPDEFSHVYAALHLGGRGWVAADSSTDDSTLGWRPPVPMERVRRWVEPAIEDVLGAQDFEKAKQLYLNGRSANGMGDFTRVEPTDYPTEFFRTIPEQRRGRVTFETPAPSYAEDWYPKEPDEAGELVEHPPRALFTAPPPAPTTRVPLDRDTLRSDQRPYYRYPASGVTRRNPSYPSAPWQKQVQLAPGPRGGMLRTIAPDHTPTQPGISVQQPGVPGMFAGSLQRIDDSRSLRSGTEILPEQEVAAVLKNGSNAIANGKVPLGVAARPFVADKLVEVTEGRDKIIRGALTKAQAAGKTADIAALAKLSRSANLEAQRARGVRIGEHRRFAAWLMQHGISDEMAAHPEFARRLMYGMGAWDVVFPSGEKATFDTEDAYRSAIAAGAHDASVVDTLTSVVNSVTSGFSSVVQTLTGQAVAPAAQAASASAVGAPTRAPAGPWYKQWYVIAPAALGVAALAYSQLKPARRARRR